MGGLRLFHNSSNFMVVETFTRSDVFSFSFFYGGWGGG